jgi:hypothetical protein
MFVSFYTILKQWLTFFWSSTPTNFSYKPPLLTSPVAFFIVYCVTQRHSAVYFSSCHIASPFLALLLNLDKVTQYNYACVCLQFCLSSNLVWFVVTCHDFPAHKTFDTIIITQCCDFKCHVKTYCNIVGFEILRAVVMKSSIIWDITLRSLLNVSGSFGETCCLYV